MEPPHTHQHKIHQINQIIRKYFLLQYSSSFPDIFKIKIMQKKLRQKTVRKDIDHKFLSLPATEIGNFVTI